MVKRMMPSFLSILNGITSRSFTTSDIRSLRRFRSHRPNFLREVGKFVQENSSGTPYGRGQCFIHKLYAYRGVVVCSKNCNVFERLSNNQTRQETLPFYRVLIDEEDWSEMNFDADLYLDSTGHLAELYGVDIVSHKEIQPFDPSIDDAPIDETNPTIRHSLYEQFFRNPSDSSMNTADRQSSNKDGTIWPFPLVVFKQVTGSVEVQVSTFNLGINLHKNCNWRVVIRVRNGSDRKLTLKRTVLKVSSMIVEKIIPDQDLNASLNRFRQVMQFSRIISLPCTKGNNLWGHIAVEDEEGNKHSLQIPPVVLDINSSGIAEQTKTIH